MGRKAQLNGHQGVELNRKISEFATLFIRGEKQQ